MFLWASADISKALRISLRSPGLMRAFKQRNKARYSRRISFFSCSAFRLYLGISATVSMTYEDTLITRLIERVAHRITRILQGKGHGVLKKFRKFQSIQRNAIEAIYEQKFIPPHFFKTSCYQSSRMDY